MESKLKEVLPQQTNQTLAISNSHQALQIANFDKSTKYITKKDYGEFLLYTKTYGIDISTEFVNGDKRHPRVEYIRGRIVFEKLLDTVTMDEYKVMFETYFEESGKYHKEYLPQEVLKHLPDNSLHTQEQFLKALNKCKTEESRQLMLKYNVCYSQDGTQFRYRGGKRPLEGFSDKPIQLLQSGNKNTTASTVQKEDLKIGAKYLQANSDLIDARKLLNQKSKEISNLKSELEEANILINAENIANIKSENSILQDQNEQKEKLIKELKNTIKKLEIKIIENKIIK